MTEAMPFLQKTILLSYDPRPFYSGDFLLIYLFSSVFSAEVSGVSGSVEGLSSV